jgi:flavorubredoxin
MHTAVTEIAEDTFRISTFLPDYRIQFNQFLIRDEQPFIMHTGFKGFFQATLEAIAGLIDPARLRWVGFSHFESDECGATNELLQIAPSAQPVCSFVSATVNMQDFAERPARPLADDEMLVTGRHHLRFLASPHVPHGWDAGLFFDETEQTMLCSDLFFHPGDPEPVTEGDIVARARDAIRAGLASPLANDIPFTPYTIRTINRLADLRPKMLAVMHGSSYRGDCRAALLSLAGAISELLGGEQE